MSAPQMDSTSNKKVCYPHFPLETVDLYSKIHHSEEGFGWVKMVLRKVGLFLRLWIYLAILGYFELSQAISDK